MADRWTALNSFWNSFGLHAYDENTVPDGAELPYITYEAATSQLDDPVYMSASIWYKSNSWAEVSQKAEEISNYIEGGAGVQYDSGRLWIRRGVPFAQRMSEPTDPLVRRIVLQIFVEYQ